jgi:hypothetical protein
LVSAACLIFFALRLRHFLARIPDTIMAKQANTETNQISAEQIARRAYEIWEAEGRPDGRATDHWIKAEAILRDGAPVESAPREAAPATTGKPTATRAPRRKNLEMVS